jgi:hypothetical protein
VTVTHQLFRVCTGPIILVLPISYWYSDEMYAPSSDILNTGRRPSSEGGRTRNVDQYPGSAIHGSTKDPFGCISAEVDARSLDRDSSHFHCEATGEKYGPGNSALDRLTLSSTRAHTPAVGARILFGLPS